MIVIIVIVMMILKSTGNAINSCTTIKLFLFVNSFRITSVE